MRKGLVICASGDGKRLGQTVGKALLGIGNHLRFMSSARLATFGICVLQTKAKFGCCQVSKQMTVASILLLHIRNLATPDIP